VFSTMRVLPVFDDKKEAFIPLTEFYHDQFNRISESSVIAYLNTLEPFFYWLKYKSYYKARKVCWDDEPEAVKEAVRQYLIEQMHCKIRGRDGHEGVYLTSKSSLFPHAQKLDRRCSPPAFPTYIEILRMSEYM
jgi:hypothetical protein